MTQEKLYEKEIVYVDPDIEDLIPGFLQSRRDEIVTIRRCLAESDMKEVIRLGHGMKGAGAGYGFDEISAIGRSIEQAGNADDREAVEACMKRLESYLSALVIEIEDD